MRVTIQSLGFKAGQDMEGYIREKVNKLTPNDKIVGANVVLFLGAAQSTREHFCDIRLEIPGNDLFVKDSGADFYQAIDQTVDKLQAMLRKAKEKAVDQWQGKIQ